MSSESIAQPPPLSEEVAPGTPHEKLEGWIPAFASDAEICIALEKAFDYRGDVTLTLKDGGVIEGYVFDRSTDGDDLSTSFVRVMPKTGGDNSRIAYSEIARLEFTGRDTAAGKSFETWVKKHAEKKAAGEKNIRIEPEKLD